ncbi:hypothetical protein [Rhizosaccharibacter radicis]|uniref:Uncharacterized protein n=1 Tax=Rhizosaccharibacter radicis TaxID=2782605 RepID=A0ABT1VTU4_9PROT|nr:hypothetical protein [Acetobacteraceae bacterium KSS12]
MTMVHSRCRRRIGMVAALIAALPAACGPQPPGSSPPTLIERGAGPAMPDYLGNGGMGPGGSNGGMGTGGGIQGGGGPALP